MIGFALLAQVVVTMTSIGAIKYISPEWQPEWEGAKGDEWLLLPSMTVLFGGVFSAFLMLFLFVAVPFIFMAFIFIIAAYGNR